MKFFWGLVFGLLLSVAIPLVAVYTGSVNMGASQEPSELEKAVGKMAWENCMHMRAPDVKNPFASDPNAVKVGLAHYQENCMVCHAAPGMESSEIAKGMNPAPPILNDIDDLTDGHLYWVVKNGIRMTGMPAFGPTHSDDEIWKIVAFLRHIKKLTPEERQMLQASGEEEEHHHHEAAEETVQQTQPNEHSH